MFHPGTPYDEAEVRAAVADGNLPTLLMVLHQLTGDHRWLADPYRPRRPRGMEDNDDGRLPPEVQTEIRGAAVAAILAWSAGAAIASPRPSQERFGEMLCAIMGEEVPAEFWPMLATQMGFSGTKVDPPQPDVEKARAVDYSVAIIGAGISGLFAALRLREAGIPYVVLERGDTVGGAWRVNRYPGARVDTPSYLYSYLFHPWDWKTHFAVRDEVLAYLESLVDEYDLRSSIRFRTEVVEASWVQAESCWNLRVSDAGAVESEVVVSAVITAVGLFTEPAIPEIPGLEQFPGPICHSAAWPDRLDLTGKRVALVGSGASAMQVGTAIVDEVADLKVIQRTPQWIVPVPHYFDEISPGVHWLCDHVPFYRLWYRAKLMWMYNDKVHPSFVIDPEWPDAERSVNAMNDRHREFMTRFIADELADRPDLYEQSVPSYPPYGKRILLENGWYRMLKRDNVELISQSVTEITARGLRTSDGTEHEVDAIALCTGFQASRHISSLDITGRDGVRLTDAWDGDNASAYLGTCAPGFPNLFFVYGPGTNAGSGSFLTLAESEIDFIMSLLTTTIAEGHASVEVRQDVCDAYNRAFDEANARMVWSHPGMGTYVRNRRGRVTVNMPWRNVDFWRRMLVPEREHFSFTAAHGRRTTGLAHAWPLAADGALSSESAAPSGQLDASTGTTTKRETSLSGSSPSA
jgi:4-hydroxyacetophenone monooxygenase